MVYIGATGLSKDRRMVGYDNLFAFDRRGDYHCLDRIDAIDAFESCGVSMDSPSLIDMPKAREFPQSFPYTMYEKRDYSQVTGYEIQYPKEPSPLLQLLDGLTFPESMFRD